MYSVWDWHVLVHVCRKWRKIVFASPNRLGLRLRCTPTTPVRKTLDIWPPLPIFVEIPAHLPLHPAPDDDNLITAFEERDRVCVVALHGLMHGQLERFAAVMQEPFPALTHLCLESDSSEVAPALPATFMGGSAPRLQSLQLKGISFPALPNFTLSPNDLTLLNLHDIPSTGYISPGTMVAFLSTLTSLQFLTIEFKTPILPPDPRSQRVTPPVRVLLPVLSNFRFKGVSEYLEDTVAQIDTPLLTIFDVVFFNQLTFTIPRLSQFIHRTETIKSYSQLRLTFTSHQVLIGFSHGSLHGFSLSILCSPSDWQLLSIVELCGPPLCLSPNVERLQIFNGVVDLSKWQDNMDPVQWREVLRPFTSVRELYVSDTMWPLLAPGLKELTGERTMDVLPMLGDLFVEYEPAGSLPKTVEPFVTARKNAGHSVVVHCRDGKDRDWKAVDWYTYFSSSR